MDEVINGYIVTKKLGMAEGGMCRWGFAQKDGREYFIKEFLAPKYPLDPSVMGEEITRKMRQVADKFEQDRRAYYDQLRGCRTGNNIIVLDFFRDKSKYYAVTDKVDGPVMAINEVAALGNDQKYTMMKSLLYSLAKLHEAGIVHSDLKPENILVHRTQSAYCTAKIIDFDSGYLESAPPENIVGSQNYFSPEAILKTKGQPAAMTTKSDVFALGLLLHQYWCGEMPKISEEYHYVGEAVLNDSPLRLNVHIPDALRELITSMLQKQHSDRPSAWQAWARLFGIADTEVPVIPVPGVPEITGPWRQLTLDDL